jgi:predicted enzyme involved in methoxymalonyl-ACP biosynthesis
VLGRQLERLMLDCAVAAARRAGVARLTGVYRPTQKNALVADLFTTLGFSPARQQNSGESRYELDISKATAPYSAFIELVSTNAYDAAAVSAGAEG